MIQVLLVDDHPVVRSSLQAVILSFDDLELVGEAVNGEMAVQLCGLLQPDVVLMDILMPCMDGVTATRLIRQRYPHIQVLALTSFLEDSLVQGVLAAGASGYLLKNVSADELVTAIRAAYRGRATFSTELVAAMPAHLHAVQQLPNLQFDPLPGAPGIEPPFLISASLFA